MITEPFFTTKGEHGSGLGLSVARKVIGTHDGHIEFDSVAGKGTTVSVWLPVATGEIAPGATGAPPPKPAKRVPDVLVIEDDADMLVNMKMSLVGVGLTAEGASDAAAGLAQFEEYLKQYGEAPAIVITDLHMPGLLGTELARHVKKLAPNTRVILISGYVTEEATHLACPHVDVIIKKPFRFQDLLKHLRLDEGKLPAG